MTSLVFPVSSKADFISILTNLHTGGGGSTDREGVVKDRFRSEYKLLLQHKSQISNIYGISFVFTYKTLSTKPEAMANIIIDI